MEKEKTVGFHIRSLSNLIKRQMNPCNDIQEDNITPIQGWVIAFIYNNEDKDIFQRDIEAQFAIRRSTATAMLQLMEKNGFITRKPVLHDLRLKKITLTDKAIEHHKAVGRRIEELEEKMESGISAKELSEFFATIAKIKENLEKK